MSFNILPDTEGAPESTHAAVQAIAKSNVLADVQINSPRTTVKKSAKATAFFIDSKPTDPVPSTQVAENSAGHHLYLRGFQAPTFIDFGNVSLDDGKVSKELTLINDGDAKLSVAKSNLNGPTDDGFDVEFCTRRSKTAVNAGAEQQCQVTFEPKTFGSFRAQFVLKLSSRHRCTVIVAGTVIDSNLPTKKKKSLRNGSRRTGGSSKAKQTTRKSAFRRVPANVVPAPVSEEVATDEATVGASEPAEISPAVVGGVSKSVLDKSARMSTHLKKKKKAASGQAKRAPRGKQLYDDKWDDKQQEGFTTWMNHVFNARSPFNGTPAVAAGAVATDTKDSDAESKGGEEHIFSALATKKSEAAVRKKALSFYQSERVCLVRESLAAHVTRGTLTVRSDKHVGRDVGLRKTVFEILFSYELCWLRLGLETVFGEIISFPAGATGRRRHAILKQFVVDRLIVNAELKRKFKRTVKGTTSKEFTVAAGNYALEKVFMLVFLLDHAHDQRFIPHQIRLFRKSAKFKSSRALLVTFAKEFLQVCAGLENFIEILPKSLNCC